MYVCMYVYIYIYISSGLPSPVSFGDLWRHTMALQDANLPTNITPTKTYMCST